MRKYYKLVTYENIHKLIYNLQDNLPLKFGDKVVGKVVKWVKQFGDIYGKVVFEVEVKNDDFVLILNGNHVSSGIIMKEFENV